MMYCMALEEILENYIHKNIVDNLHGEKGNYNPINN